MSLKIYNTLTRKKEDFKPIKKDEVGMYSCGPTVYWYQHIGNLRTYIFADILKRTLILNEYKVNHIINVTDVGHLTSDSDIGDDKMEKAAAKEGKTANEIAKYYFELFQKDLKKLNIQEPSIWSWATKHIKEQIELVKVLEKKGYTYKTSDGIYFDTSKVDDYGKLALLNIEGLQEGKRVEAGEKKNKTDFALWKFSSEPGKRKQEWESPWGLGFPGWHIECSAMSSKYLGKQFDIHTGGIDHIPIHHTNEIAQSECAFDVNPWVKYWLHGAFLELKDGKMSKSTGKIWTISDLEEKGFDALDYRYYCLLTHYRKRMIFSLDGLESAKIAYTRLKRLCLEIKDNKKINKKYLEEFKEAINDDLNMPEAIQVTWKLINDEKAEGKVKTIKKIDEVLGLNLLTEEKQKIPKEILELVKEREEARKNKDWKNSDDIREKIKELGYAILDSKEGAKIEKI
jgi:cysteinyl-tRNA synthetase